MHHIFISNDSIDFASKTIKISKDDKENFNHLVSVLRVRNGENILCSASVSSTEFEYDYNSVVTNIFKDYIELQIIENVINRELPIKVNLYQCITKGDKIESIIDKTIELGVHSIHLVDSKFCIGKIESNKIQSKIKRYNAIAKASAEQSKRHIIPVVYEPISFFDMVNSADKSDVNILFYENSNEIIQFKNVVKNIKNSNSNICTINIVVGPEGGFDNDEVKLAKENGYLILSLGKRILRTETASISAMSIIMYEMED